MPIYSYVCEDCGEKFDLFFGIGGTKEELICKKCESKNIKRSFSSFGVKQSSGTNKSSLGDSCPTGTCPYT